MWHALQWLAVGGVILSLGGCGSLHLYNKEADVAATSAKEDYDASKITDALKAELAMLNALEAKEVEAFRKVTRAKRNLELLSLVNESGTSLKRTTDNGLVARFNRLVDERLLALSGPSVDPLKLSKSLDEAKRKLRDAELKEKMARSQLVMFHVRFNSMPACNDAVAALNGNSSAEAAAALTKDASFQPKNIPASVGWGTSIKNLGAGCTELLSARTAMAETLQMANSGQLARSIDEADTQERLLKNREDEAKAAGTALKKAAADLAAAQKSVKDAGAPVDLTCNGAKPATAGAGTEVPAVAATPVADPVEQADPVATKNALCAALAKLTQLGDFGIKVLSEERLSRINTILEAMSGLEPSAGETPLEPSLALLSASSRFAQALRQYQLAGTLPALEPLLIEKQLASAQFAYARAGEELAKARARYAQEFKDASFLEVDLLLRAKAELGSLGPAPATGTACTAATAVFCASMRQLLEDKALAQTAGGAGESANRRAYRAMALLSETYSVARDRQQTAELQLIDADYRDSQLRSEASIAAWNALISVPIDQLKAYHAGGVTPQETAQLLQALGVIGVAVRIK